VAESTVCWYVVREKHCWYVVVTLASSDLDVVRVIWLELEQAWRVWAWYTCLYSCLLADRMLLLSIRKSGQTPAAAGFLRVASRQREPQLAPGPLHEHRAAVSPLGPPPPHDVNGSVNEWMGSSRQKSWDGRTPLTISTYLIIVNARCWILKVFTYCV
jgi:hypothetical protein